MEKYEQLERLKKLEEDGTITTEEFEAEKQKILNEKITITRQGKKNKKGIAKIFFILFGVSAILEIISWIMYGVGLANDNGSIYYFTKEEAVGGYFYKLITDIGMYGIIIFAILLVLFLIIGIVLKIKEKGGIKIVN